MKKEINDNGFVVFRDDDAFQYIDIYSITWAEKGTIPLQMAVRTTETQTALLKTQSWLGEKYLRPIFGNYHCDYCDIVSGIDDIVYEWHNDYELDRVNLGILLYFSDTDEDTGTSLSFRDYKTKKEHASFYPKLGDVCIINHTEKFEHQVSKPKFSFPRIVGRFHYYVDYT